MSEWGLTVTGCELLRGCSGGLGEKTAVVEVEISGAPAVDAQADARFRAVAAALCPEDPLQGVTESAWPDAFLLPSGAVEAAPVERVGRWLVALTVAIQRWARDPVWRGRVLSAEPDRLRLAIGWYRQHVLSDALDYAVRLAEQALQPEVAPVARLRDHFGGRWSDLRAGGLAPSTLRFLHAAVSRGMPFDILPSYTQIGWGAAAERLDMALTGHTGWIATALAKNPVKANRTLAAALLPVPPLRVAGTAEEASRAAAELGWPVLVRPLNERTGPGVTADVTTAEDLGPAFDRAARASTSVLIEGQLPGAEHRLLVVRGRLLAAVRRTPTAEDVTAAVHPDTVALAQRAARVVGLDIAGVDVVTPDVTRSWREVGAAVCAVSAQPDFTLHRLAAPHRDLEGEVVDTLFAGRSARIPTAAISGTNGKTTTTAMLHRIWSAAGRRTGTCTTAAVVIGDEVVSADNLSGQPGGRLILNDPTVQAAVFEMPRKGLIYFGHPCDRYDVAALLNVRDDHIGADGIDTLEQMAELKAEVLERARDAVVVNADDPLCLAMLPRAGSERHILVSADPSNPAVGQHRRAGGEAVFPDLREGRRWIVLASGEDATGLLPLDDIPATMRGLLRVNESNAMFAAALAWAQGIELPTIRAALSSFGHSLEHNPGRYTLIDGLPFTLLLDYAHNPDSVAELCRVVPRLDAPGRRILCSVQIGNRHPDHLPAAAPDLAECFDEFVIGCHPAEVTGYPGDDPVAAMLAAAADALTDQGVDAARITTVPDPIVAIRTALAMARPADLLVVLAEPEELRAELGAVLSGSGTTPPHR